MQSAGAPTCLLEAPLTECTAGGALRNTRFVTNLYLSPTPAALASIQPRIVSAVQADGAAVDLSDGDGLPDTIARGDSCDNVLAAVSFTVLTQADYSIEAVDAAVVLATVVSDGSGTVATRPTFSVAFRAIGSEVRAVDTGLGCTLVGRRFDEPARLGCVHSC